MKNRNLLWIALVGLFLIGCSKSEDTQLTTTERLDNIEMPNLGKMNFDIPEVPDYVAPEHTDSALERGLTVNVGPGVNQLQDIINNAAPGTTIRLRAGTHQEDNTLVINHEIHLRAKGGAVLSLGGDVGLFVVNADKTSIKDLTIDNIGAGVIGIAVENSEKFTFKRNTMTGFVNSIVLEEAYKANIMESTIVGSDPANGLGVTVMNGEKITVWFNDISGNVFGVWACDKYGKCYNNELHDNVFGLILCKVPEGSFSPVFSIGTGGSEFPATEWKVKNNVANNNVWGYIAIDGANNNFLSNNEGSNNAFVDLELADETNILFGFTTPTSHNNTVFADDLDYIDCGLDNTVYGGNEVALPCSE